MTEYTPEMATIRKAYRNSAYTGGGLPEMSDAEFDRWLAAHNRAAEKRGATAALLCERDTSWEHHDQTDDFPCARCLSRADQIEGATE
ncbi:hypothetical protein [Citricoccus sp. K5]|uniref:hypothetical protein n=1 Tax=Citricoccus sp. K5 TaxID=2653135 RepID=UPI0012F01847|nr:hypothetical protein [Citricoccus sp. K5]VXB24529.1 hypothetical protein CITRIK5_30034 [Citricoccus sp. K5]